MLVLFYRVDMANRDLLLVQAIIRGICQSRDRKPRGLLSRIFSFFRLFTIVLRRYSPGLFDNLRSDVWGIDRADYQRSCATTDESRALLDVGDLGYSGSVSAVRRRQLGLAR